jgi:hypothetical protein
MSTKADRRARAVRHILPIKVRVRQTDGSVQVQRVDADVRTRDYDPSKAKWAVFGDDE